jgi:uncharacterized membrane protein
LIFKFIILIPKNVHPLSKTSYRKSLKVCISSQTDFCFTVSFISNALLNRFLFHKNRSIRNFLIFLFVVVSKNALLSLNTFQYITRILFLMWISIYFLSFLSKWDKDFIIWQQEEIRICCHSCKPFVLFDHYDFLLLSIYLV